MKGEGVLSALATRLRFLRIQTGGDPSLLTWMESQEAIKRELLSLVVALAARVEDLEETQP